MSIDLLTERAAAVARPKAAEAPSEATPAKRSALKEQAAVEAGSVKLEATKEMDDLVQVVRQAPTEVSEARLEQLTQQVRRGEYSPNLQSTALAILEELEMLPDPPYDTLP